MTYSIIKKSQLEGALRLDAEYYQPEYLLSFATLLKNRSETLFSLCKISDGNHVSISESYNNEGVRYLRGKDLNDFFISDNDPIYIPEKIYNTIKRSHIYKNDVLISIVGTVGMVSVVADDFDKLTGNCKIAILRPRKINPWYLSAFLISSYGQHQIQRKVAGAVQLGIILKDLAEIKVPTFDDKVQFEIEKLVKGSYKEQLNSENLYQQAENLLLEESGLQNFKAENEICSIVNLLDVKNSNRLDAEYFQPKYHELIKHIKNNCRGVKLGELVNIKKGLEPGAEEYKEEGKLFIRVSSLSKFGVNLTEEKYLNEEMYNKLKDDFEPQAGEILLTKDASIGVAYVLKEKIPGIVSGGILRLKLKNKEMEDEYLALCLNSLVGQWQAERDAGGSVIAHWKPEQIKKLLIPILSHPIQQKIAGLVRQSHEARKKTKELLAEAKQKVEEMIEKGK